MNFTKTMFALAIGSVGIMGAMSAHAALGDLNTGDVLTINAGAPVFDGNGNFANVNVSWFGMDTNGNGKIAGTEKTALSQGTTGIKIGDITAAGDYHFGASVPTDTGVVVDSWDFFGSTGSNFNTVAITGGTTSGLNFSGWKVAWNNVPSIDMGGIAWGDGFANGVANFVWSGTYGDSYTLDYHATVPASSPNFPGVQYALHFEGVVNAAAPVPEASTYGMMLAGLGLVGFAVRRRKSAI